MTEGPYTPEFFATALNTSYASAQRIVPLMLALAPARSVLDVGCGTGHFLRAFREAGVSDITGVDGDYVPRDQLVIDAGHFLARDLSSALDLQRRYDLVVSLEVAEHLPPASAESFVDSLGRHGSVVLFSAAIPDQGGTNHVNERWTSYWAELFARRGYSAYDPFRSAIWHDPQIAWWYRQNIVVFADAQARAAHPALAALDPVQGESLDRVHPENYQAKARGWHAAVTNLQRLQNFLTSESSFDVVRSEDGRYRIDRRQRTNRDSPPAAPTQQKPAPRPRDPLLRVIIPARRNAADNSTRLAAVLHSVNALGLACELVLLDDDSDREEKLIDTFLRHKPTGSAHKFVVARSNKHRHYTGVFSIGLHLARGENVAFVSN